MKKIFLIDNDNELTLDLEILLTMEGFDVTESNDGREALQILSRETFNLVIADICLIGLDDYAILNWHTVNRPETKVIMITGQESGSYSQAALRMGAQYCLEKPISKDHLIEIVNDALQEEGFSGTISKISLADYLQFCIYTTATKTFEVIKGRRKGVIFIEDGVISYAKYEDIEGVEAFNHIISLQGGRINEIRLPNIPKPNIFIESGFLLLEAARLHDEKQLDSDMAVAGATEAAPMSEGNNPSTQDPGQNEEEPFHAGPKSEICKILEGISGVREFCVFDKQDILHDRSVKSKKIMQIAPSLHFKLSDVLSALMGCGPLKYLVFRTKDGVRYVLASIDESQVVVGLNPGKEPAEFLNELFTELLLQ